MKLEVLRFALRNPNRQVFSGDRPLVSVVVGFESVVVVVLCNETTRARCVGEGTGPVHVMN